MKCDNAIPIWESVATGGAYYDPLGDFYALKNAFVSTQESVRSRGNALCGRVNASVVC